MGTEPGRRWATLFAGLLTLMASTWIAARYTHKPDPVLSIKHNLLYGVIGIVLMFVSLTLNDLYFHLRLP